ncbi:hypothetical protein EMA8858_02645 [Emticicia aquatica]|uniref:Uncharacterized protein n=1 Tax=Emticicia aquatica TaxID=1681835 RepID=A0ABM9AS87_9BACT|nr:hypothetical protein EMA8858_02645 [Emticicia aquatica]
MVTDFANLLFWNPAFSVLIFGKLQPFLLKLNHLFGSATKTFYAKYAYL